MPAAGPLDLEARRSVKEAFDAPATSRQIRAFLELSAFGDILLPMDSFGRVIDYLRISVTDRCNERCLYCMPEGYKGWAQKADHLTADEIIRVVAAACNLGFRKFRLTGGEPCIRKDLVQIARGISAAARRPLSRGLDQWHPTGEACATIAGCWSELRQYQS